MQKVIFKIIPIVLVLLAPTFLVAQNSPSDELARADSLFRMRRYTQSMELYRNILEKGYSSPSMLLKMSFIAEGLNRPEEALLYLDRYFLNTGDVPVQNKIQDLASEYDLVGWETSGSDAMRLAINRYYELIVPTVLAIGILLLALMYYQKKKLHSKPVATGLFLFLVLAALFALVNFGPIRYGIIEDQASPIMSGPSSGSDVVSIVKAGHRVKVLGRQDTWVRILWDGREAFIRENHLKAV